MGALERQGRARSPARRRGSARRPPHGCAAEGRARLRRRHRPGHGREPSPRRSTASSSKRTPASRATSTPRSPTCELEFGGIDIAFLNAGIAIGHGRPGELHRRPLPPDHARQRRRRRLRDAGRDPGDGAATAVARSSRRRRSRGIIPFPPDPDLRRSPSTPSSASSAAPRRPLRDARHHGEHRQPGHDGHQHPHRRGQEDVRRGGLPADGGGVTSPRRWSGS